MGFDLDNELGAEIIGGMVHGQMRGVYYIDGRVLDELRCSPHPLLDHDVPKLGAGCLDCPFWAVVHLHYEVNVCIRPGQGSCSGSRGRANLHEE